jgi:hypothetical protein
MLFIKEKDREGEKIMEAYCMKCKKKREMEKPTVVTMKGGRKAKKGTCQVCGTKMFRIGG